MSEENHTKVTNASSISSSPPGSNVESDIDSHLQDEKSFDPEFMHQLLVACVDESNKTVNALQFVHAIAQVPKLFAGLTSVLQAGNGALIDKMGIVKKRLAETAEELKVDAKQVSLQDVIERDIRNKWTHSGKRARRATRNIVRLVWFLDFIVALFTKLGSGNPETVRDVIHECWVETLGPRNKTMVNMATKGLIKVARFPKKSAVFELFNLDEVDEDKRRETFEVWARDANNVAEIMWTYFKEKNVEKVP